MAHYKSEAIQVPEFFFMGDLTHTYDTCAVFTRWRHQFFIFVDLWKYMQFLNGV